jgi:hypothetical protein
MISTHRIMPASHTRQWWLAGGIHPSQVVAAYQPKGAADLAASYVNLANPGTNDATVGVEPTFDSSGWVFDGSTTYLIGPPSNSAGFAVRFSNASFSTRMIIGVAEGTNLIGFVNANLGLHRTYRNSGNNIAYTVTNGAVANGTATINQSGCYLNGTKESGETQGNYSGAINYYIGCRNMNGSPDSVTNAKIQACCFFASGTTLTPAQVAALSAAMAAL